jgi:peptidoglycan/xylan/chitin deacetylase (PgdA/CDA1 family)
MSKKIEKVVKIVFLVLLFLFLGGGFWLLFEYFGFFDSKTKGVITITFDDGPSNIYHTAFPIMKKYGFHGNVAVVTRFANGPEKKRMWAELNELSDAGWSILSHTVNHKALIELNEKELNYELKESRETLKMFKGSNFLVYPGHHVNKHVVSVAKKYYDGARGSYIYKYGGNTIPLSNRFMIASYAGDYPLRSEHKFLTTAHIKRYWDYAHRKGKWGATYFHPITKDMLPVFEELMRYLYEKKYRVVAWHEIEHLIVHDDEKKWDLMIKLSDRIYDYYERILFKLSGTS